MGGTFTGGEIVGGRSGGNRWVPSLPAPMVTSTQGNKSARQPLGFSLVARAALQSSCCHIW